MSRRRSVLRNGFEYLAYRLTRLGAGVLGPAALARLGNGAGALYLSLGRRRRRILTANLSLVYPEMTDAERRQLEAAVARHFGRVALDSLRVLSLDPQRLMAEVTISGRDHLETALARAGGKGIFLLSAHIGQWEVAALVAGLLLPHGLPVINRPLDNPFLDTELRRLRTRFGNSVLGRDKIARGVLRCLAKGTAVGILIDQRAREGEGIEVEFLGQPSSTHPVLARFAARTRAPVVPVFALTERPGHYHVRFGEPVYHDELNSEELEERALTRRYMEITEAIIRERPEQWLWYHDRWRQPRRRS